LSNHFDAWEINSALALHGDSNSETGKCIYMLLQYGIVAGFTSGARCLERETFAVHPTE
jgi:hypothetical protein